MTCWPVPVTLSHYFSYFILTPLRNESAQLKETGQKKTEIFCVWEVGNMTRILNVPWMGSQPSLLCWPVLRASGEAVRKGCCCQGLWARMQSAGGPFVSTSNPSVGPEALWHGLGYKEQNRVAPLPAQIDVRILLTWGLFAKLLSVLLLDTALKILRRVLCTI